MDFPRGIEYHGLRVIAYDNDGRKRLGASR